MNKAARLSAILDLLAETGRLDLGQITSRLGVSVATARRDLTALAEQGLLNRTRGGAVGKSVAYELPIRYVRGENTAQKQLIAAAASELVAAGDIVGLCGGTTSTALADVLSARADLVETSPGPGLTIVTNAINIAAQFIMRPQVKTVVVGGVVHPHSYELVGPYSEMVLEKISLDIVFLGVNGLDPVRGAAVHNEGEARVNQLMARRARRAVIIADSSKIGATSFATIGGSELFDTIVTDSGIKPADAAAFRDHGIEVIVA